MSPIRNKLIISMLMTSTLLVYGQDIKPTNLCPTRTVTVTAGSGGIIEHTEGQSCTLTLEGFRSGAYVGIVGAIKSLRRACDKISIDGEDYCGGVGKGSFLAIQLSSTRLTMSSPSYSSSYDVEYYSNIVHCGDIPSIFRTTNSSPPTPWLPGTKFRYFCVSNYTIEGNSSIECEIVDTRARWSDLPPIECIYGPRCLSAPPTIEHATYIVSGDNRIASYQCDAGYKYNTRYPTSLCSYYDTDTVHWTWREVQVHCKPVECRATAGFTSIANGSVTSAGDNARYHYKDLFTYVCDTGYHKNVEIIKCQSNRSWSATPRCDAVECELGPEFKQISHGVTTFEGSYHYTNIFRHDCDPGYKRNEEIIQCQSNGRWTAIPACTLDDTTLSSTSTQPVDDTTFSGSTSIPASSGGKVAIIIACILGIPVLILVITGIAVYFIKYRKTFQQSIQPQESLNKPMASTAEDSQPITHPLKSSGVRRDSNKEDSQPITHPLKRSGVRRASKKMANKQLIHSQKST